LRKKANGQWRKAENKAKRENDDGFAALSYIGGKRELQEAKSHRYKV